MARRSESYRLIDNLKFIRLLKKHPCIYDPLSLNSKSLGHRDMAFIKILQDMDDPALRLSDLKKKYKVLRDTYIQVLKKEARDGVRCDRAEWYDEYRQIFNASNFAGKWKVKTEEEVESDTPEQNSLEGDDEENADITERSLNKQELSIIRLHRNRWRLSQYRKFIQLLKKFPIIWDNSKVYHGRRKAYNKVCQLMAIPHNTPENMKNKYYSMRATYFQIQRKIKQIEEEEGRVVKPTLEWFDDFTEIIEQSANSRHTLYSNENLPRILKVQGSVGEDEEDYVDDEQIEGDDQQMVEFLEDEEVETLNNPLEVYVEPQVKREHRKKTALHEFSIFGESVGAQLRMMPIKNALKMQLRIQTILTEERIKLQGSDSE